jgi:large repetitive protein
VLSGTTKKYGTFSFKIEATDSTTPKARAGEGTVTLEVTPTPVTIKTTGLPKGTEGKPYSSTLKAGGGAPPYTWSISHGSLPKGLTLGSGGSVTGTSRVSGTYDITLEAVDSFKPGDSAKKALSLVISPPRT